MNLLILGANSDIADAIAHKFAAVEKVSIYLASRDTAALDKKKRDLEIRYNVKAVAIAFDAVCFESHRRFYETLEEKPDVVVACFGYLGNQTAAQTSFREAQKTINTNFIGAASILEVVAADFERRGHGHIIGIASVAGERGRQSNYFYGAAKGAFIIYLSGLRNRLHRSHVAVTTVLPGFVQTKMTASMDLPEKLSVNPHTVANDIYHAYKKSKNIIYTKWLWRWIMLIIKTIPEDIFKRLKL